MECVEVAFAGFTEVEPGSGDDGGLGVFVCHGCKEGERTGYSSYGEYSEVVEEGEGVYEGLQMWD